MKTNQIFGSQIPMFFKKVFGKKLIVRCGFLHSYSTEHKTDDKEAIRRAVELENAAFSLADMGIVSTPWQRDIVLERYNVDPGKIRVIPNYVITDVFKPYKHIRKMYDLVFVGRGQEQKNLDNFFKALYQLKKRNQYISLLMVGGCCSETKIINMTEQYGLDVTFKGNVANSDLPGILNLARVFILPSNYEGHPKVLLEAMSCGLPCIGTDVSGIKEDIEHLKTGYLCGTDYESIARAVETVLADEILQRALGENAREYIRMKYDINRILKMELDVIQEVISA